MKTRNFPIAMTGDEESAARGETSLYNPNLYAATTVFTVEPADSFFIY